jgi:TnpA family transposase
MPQIVRRIHSAYLGQKVLFPDDMSDFEVHEFFALSSADKRAIRVDSPRKMRLALALQLGFLRMTGTTLDAYDYVPRPVLDFLGKQFHVRAPMLATLRALYRRRMTRFRHQRWACPYLGISRLSAEDERTLMAALGKETTVTVDRDQLTQRAYEMRYARRVRIPARRTVERLMRRALQQVEEADAAALRVIIPAATTERWYQLLVHAERDGVSVLEWMCRPPRKRGVKTRALAIDKLDHLRSTFCELVGRNPPIPPERLRAYARRLHRRRLDHAKELVEPGRRLEVVGFLYSLLGRQADRVLRMIEIAIARIWRQAHQTVGSTALESPLSPQALLEELYGQVDQESVSDAAYRSFSRERLKGWRAMPVSRAARVRRLLVDEESRIRPLLREILALRLDGPRDDPVLRALGNLKGCYDFPPPELYDDARLPFSPVWQTLVDDVDRARALRAYEAATLWAVRRGLRSGRLFFAFAEEYRGKDRLLIPIRDWEALKPAFLERRLLPETPEPFLERLVAQVEAGLAALDEAVQAGDLYVRAKGIHLRLGEDPAVTVESDVTAALRKQLVARNTERVGDVQLPELLMNVDSQTGFSCQLHGRAAHSSDELISGYAGVLAAAANVEARAMAHMVPGLPAAAILRALRLFEGEPRLRRASDAVVEWMRALPIVKAWGLGFEASADMMSLDTSRHVYLARQDPRRRRFAVGSYLDILKEWGIVYDQPLPLMTRQVGAAIDGRMRQVITHLTRLSVDTHGYSDFGMTGAKVLGFDLCPRIYGMADRKLHVLRGMKVPESIAAHVVQDVSLKSAREHWSELLRVFVTVEAGWSTATRLLSFYGSASRGEGVYLAGTSVGKLLRTIYLCDYFTVRDFRQAIYSVLERGESVHALQRAIHIGAVPVRRGRDLAEFGVVSSALALVTNIVMAYNAGQLRKTVDAAVASGLDLSACLRALERVGPVSYGHVNFRGTYFFPVERYAARVLRAAA